MNSFLENISKIILRDLDVLEKEIALYPTTDSIWMVKGEIKNSAGNLALHLCGNLQHFIGAVLGNSQNVVVVTLCHLRCCPFAQNPRALREAHGGVRSGA